MGCCRRQRRPRHDDHDDDDNDNNNDGDNRDDSKDPSTFDPFSSHSLYRLLFCLSVSLSLYDYGLKMDCLVCHDIEKMIPTNNDQSIFTHQLCDSQKDRPGLACLHRCLHTCILDCWLACWPLGHCKELTSIIGQSCRYLVFVILPCMHHGMTRSIVEITTQYRHHHTRKYGCHLVAS